VNSDTQAKIFFHRSGSAAPVGLTVPAVGPRQAAIPTQCPGIIAGELEARYLAVIAQRGLRCGLR